MSATARARAAVVAAALSSALALGMAGAAYAATPDQDCEDFATQQEAQEYFEALPEGERDRLDGDGDGTACESHFEVPPGDGDGADDDAARDDQDGETDEPAPAEAVDDAPAKDRDCADFATQADAQAALDADPSDPENLDADDDGIACEEHFDTEGDQIAVKPKGGVATGGDGR